MVIKTKKFNTFSGVFTPSILTIIGVIMYLRLPAIVGQAGLLYTLGIILLAHIISVTTSLSIASLATDKPVQTGGPYYIISRSMGLPIGGTLGLALFVGYAFSISLYLIGFAESFLQYWNIEANINTIRLTGGIALLAVTVITYISTSLALKSQYVIMTAIALSLLSIFLGKHDFTPETVNLAPLADAAPFMILFGIFFPAVTGFGAGISMSGDLKDPRRSLPLGTLMAVGTGLLIYVGLTVFLAYTVDSQALMNNPQILFKISWIPVLVVAGIWGATLSSALGSILGAPRILQAIAIDKIIPGIFARGTKKNNEPRNALWIAFAIAGAGIMIGELDVIARIVSMFFITTYAFLNLAFAIESWSSPDFRPAFKIPRFISILGALSAFLVMILLDFIALAGATLVLAALYFYLQRKELLLESGDAWSSFWTNLAKKSLLKLSAGKDNYRNWRPNIILFSGGGKARPHLVELGLSLTGKLGALTDFELIETNQINISGIISEPDKSKQKKTGYFIRQLRCNTIAEGIKTVTSIYGFSGFEPNTVLLGWSKSSESSEFLSDMIKDFKTKNLNAIFLDYDKNNGFGNRDSIDIWWNGKGRHLSFSLNILRILLSDPAWRDARVRIMIVNNNTSITDSLYRNTSAFLLDKRIKAEVKVISDDFGSRSIEEIIKSYSTDTGLIMLGLTQKNIAQTQAYIEKVNKVCALPASVLLLRPSFEFEEINFIETLSSKAGTSASTDLSEIPQLPEIKIPLVNNKVTSLDENLMKTGANFCDNTIKTATSLLQSLCTNILEKSLRAFSGLENEPDETETYLRQKSLYRSLGVYQRSVLKSIDKEHPNIFKDTAATMQKGLAVLLADCRVLTREATEYLSVPYLLTDRDREKTVQFPFRKALSFYIESKFKPALLKELSVFEHTSKKTISDLRNIFFEISDLIDRFFIDQTSTAEMNKGKLAEMLKRLEALRDEVSMTGVASSHSLMEALRGTSIEIARNLSTIESHKEALKHVRTKTTDYDARIAEFSTNWETGIYLFNKSFYLDAMVLSGKAFFKNIVITVTNGINTSIQGALLSGQDLLIRHLNSALANNLKETESVVFPDKVNITSLLNESYEKAITFINELPEEIKIPEAVYAGSDYLPFSEVNHISVNLRKAAFHYIGSLFYEPFFRDLEILEADLRKAISGSREANNLLMFYLHNAPIPEGDKYNDEFNIEIFHKLIAQVTDQKSRIETNLRSLNHVANNYLNDSISRLFYQSLKETGSDIRSDERRKKSNPLTVPFIKISRRIKNRINSTFIQLLNISSSGVILSQNLFEEKGARRLQNQAILDLVEELSPEPETYNTIPVYYRNLMSSESKIPDEFWVDRPVEVEAIKTAIKRHRSGYGGALMITGIHGSGKTALTRYAVNQLFKPYNTKWIYAPERGSTEPETLMAELEKHYGSFNDYKEMFESLPNESTIVFEDLELWWERRPGGGEVIDFIIQLIKLYSHKVLFVLNCSTHAFSLMEQIFPIGEHILSNIPCSRFRTKDIQQMIMKRHRSGGTPLFYKGQNEDNISQLSYSVLFHRYFIISDGLPGAALNHWISNVSFADANKIETRKPKKRSYDALFQIKTEWLIILALFIQHKNIDARKLSEILQLPPEKSENILPGIMNAGLIVRHSKGYYLLNRYIEPLIVKVCKKKGLI